MPEAYKFPDELEEEKQTAQADNVEISVAGDDVEICAGRPGANDKGIRELEAVNGRCECRHDGPYGFWFR